MSQKSLFLKPAMFSVAVLTLLLPHSVSATTFSAFYGLGDLAGGSFSSKAYGVSADGSFIVGESQSANGLEAFQYSSSTGMVGLGYLPGGSFSSQAYGVSADGSVVVGRSRYSTSSNDGEAYLYTDNTGMSGLGSLGTSSNYNTLATGVSSDGTVIVGSDRTGADQAFRYTSTDGMMGLGSLSGHAFSRGNAVSSDGSTVVGYSYGYPGSANPTEAFVYTDFNGMVGIGSLAVGGTSEAYAVSSDGSVVVGEANAGTGARAFRWTSSGGMVDLGEGVANGVSGDGNIVVGDITGLNEAFIWDSINGLQNIETLLVGSGFDMSSWDINSVTAISTDGSTIVGYGRHAGNTEAFVARLGPAPVPVPAAVWLLGSALLGLVGFRRKSASTK